MTAKPVPFALAAAYVGVYWALAGFGRDLLFNANVDADLANDRVGALLPYLRVAACAFAALCVAATSGWAWAFSRLPLILAPFCLWTLATVAWTDSIKDTLRGSLTLLAAWGGVPILLHRLGALTSARWLLHVIVAVCIASFLVATLAPEIGRHGASDLLQGAHEGRWRGIFSHKNSLGPWAAYGAVLPLFYGGLGLSWPLRIVGGACGLACLILADSATALALAALSVCLSVGFRALRRWPLGLVLGVAAAALAALSAGAEGALEALGRSANLSGRSAIWQFAWEYVVDRPWLGYGYSTLGGAEMRARETQLFAQTIPGPESGYLALLLEGGIVGCLLLGVAYVAALAKGFAWLDRAAPADRLGVEFYLTILVSTLAEATTESNAFVVTGAQGVIFFAALFALSTAPWPRLGARAFSPLASAQAPAAGRLHRPA